MTSNSRHLLSNEGPFAKLLQGFVQRDVQLDMTEEVEQAIEEHKTLMIEAGTGTGKTFAYLVPAIESGKRTIVSTGTRNLQDQLFEKDLPTVFKALNKRRKSAILKGRQNYLCLYRLENQLEGVLFATKEMVEDLAQLRHWSQKTKTGDLSQATFIAEQSPIIPAVTSTADNCLGADCPAYAECFVVLARKKAMEADVMVINHHLLMADLVLKDEGFGELLPHAENFIIDEAHQLPDVASAFFGKHLSMRQLRELTRDVEVAYLTEAKDCKALQVANQSMEKAFQEFRLNLPDTSEKLFWTQLFQKTDTQESYYDLVDAMSALNDILIKQSKRGELLENCYERIAQYYEISQLFLKPQEEGDVQWVETFRKSFSLHSTPINIKQPFQQAIDLYRDKAWIFTSATLAINNNFSAYKDRLGWENSEQKVFPSPFNYREQALFYVPRYLKQPQDDDYTEAFVREALPLMKAAKGRTFLLFTSHRALQKAAQIVNNEGDFNCFVQGLTSKTHLLEMFKKTERAVLLGTFSFWEGVDVSGDALSFVAIDKLPFASPGDPVNQAKINAMKQQGKDPFRDFQLPEAIINLKQGAGRLIRDVTDRGVMMLGDPRIVSRYYGQQFLENLPDMMPTRNKEWVIEFLKDL